MISLRVRFLLLTALVLPACSSAEEPQDPAGASGAPESAFDPVAAAKLYNASGCSMCHGTDGAGGMMGPELRSLGEHWEVGELASFLEDPTPFVREDARLAQQAGQYQMPMQPQPSLGQADREQIASLVLSW